VIPPDEPQLIEQMLVILRSVQKYGDGKHRTFHPKQHGCVFAELAIEPNLADVLRQGVFKAPGTYPALVRFSNSKQHDDRLPDGHGAAIKLLNVKGEKLLDAERGAETQDFVFIDHPVFFAKDVADLLPLVRDFQRLIVGGVIDKSRTVLKGMLSRDHRFRLLRRAGAKRPDNPLEIRYWSTTPFKFGDGAVKFSLRPHLASPPVGPQKSADKLRLAMVSHLREREARFDLLVQLQTDAVTMPIEDATVAWDEIASPYRKVAMLILPRQTFDTPERRGFGEQLSFTPWHAIADHRPLGGINRARRNVYAAMSALRLDANGAPKREPKLADVQAKFPALA
jgi:hypothetical protein